MSGDTQFLPFHVPRHLRPFRLFRPFPSNLPISFLNVAKYISDFYFLSVDFPFRHSTHLGNLLFRLSADWTLFHLRNVTPMFIFISFSVVTVSTLLYPGSHLIFT